MGRGVVEDVAERLVADMADCIAARLGPNESGGAGSGEVPARAEPIKGFRLMLRVLWERIKRLFGRRQGDNNA
jgi:hypothetical protein